MKKIECCECGKICEVPDDIADDDIAVFCSKECEGAEAIAIYMQEQQRELDEQQAIAEEEARLQAEEEWEAQQEAEYIDYEEEGY